MTPEELLIHKDATFQNEMGAPLATVIFAAAVEAIKEYAKQESIDFFKWYGLKISGFIEYITKVKPLVVSQEIENAMAKFEGKTFEQLFELYLKSKQINTP